MKQNIRPALKLYGITVLSSVFNTIIYVSFIAIFSSFADSEGHLAAGYVLAANILALLFQGTLFVCLIYGNLWKIGNQDVNAVKFHRQTEDKWRGLKIGLIAAVPSLLSYAVLVADKLFGVWAGCAAVYRLAHVSLYPLIVWAFGTSVSNTVAGVTWGGMLLAAVPVLVMPLAAAVSYRIGYADIVIGERLVYKKKK